MARRVLVLAAVVVLLTACAALAASKSVSNRSISLASSVTITFSEDVRIVDWSTDAFEKCFPLVAHASSYTFYGGGLPRGGSFHVSWTPSDAQITSTTWTPALNVPWEEIPVAIAYPREPVITCLEALGTPVANPTTWGLPGHEVKQIRVQLAADSIAAMVELHDGDRFGNYAYVIRLWRDRENIFIRFMLPTWRMEIYYQKWPMGTWLEATHFIYVSGAAARALIPYSVLSSYVDPATLPEWEVDFHIWVISGGPLKGEDFYFPGDGSATQTTASYLGGS